MANNNAIYNAVLAGATGGSQQRWLTSANPNTYSSFLTKIQAVATAVDAAIAVNPAIGTAQARLMQSIVEGIFTGRLATGSSVAITNAIVAIYTKIATGLQPEPDNGTVLRRKNQTTTLGTAVDLNVIGGPFVLENAGSPFLLELTDPNESLFYTASVNFQVAFTRDLLEDTASIVAYIQGSIDNGPWVALTNAQIQIQSLFVSSIAFLYPVSLVLPLIQGTFIGVLPGSNSLRIRGAAELLGAVQANVSVVVLSLNSTVTQTTREGTLALELSEQVTD